MYKQFFGLRENPFNVNPDPRFMYPTRHAEEALACLTYGIQGRKGFVVLTGEVGTGKTMLLHALLDWLRHQAIATAFVFNPRLNVVQFFEYMTGDFGIRCESRVKSHVLMRLNQWLLDQYRSGSTAVLIVDEAQNLSTEVLEEIRLLTNLETSTEKLLQIVLAGQPEFEQKLGLPELRQLRQRISLRSRTYPLSLEETGHYIATRLRKAGANGQAIFSPEAVQAVHACARGIPRLINLVSEHALINAFVDHSKTISAATIQAAARDLALSLADTPSTEGNRGQVRYDESAQNLSTRPDPMLRPDEKLSRRGN